MKANALTALSLAFQRSFPGVFDHACRLLEQRRQDVSPQLTWPAWCCFPAGLAWEVLRHHYSYEREGVEPFLLAALTGWRLSRQVLKLDAAQFEASLAMPELDHTPLDLLLSQPASCLYVAYPSGVQALGSFIFLDYNGDDQRHLVFLLHLEMYRVEPLLLPLTSRHHTLGDLAADHQRCCAAHFGGEQEARLFRRAMALCCVNLNVLRSRCSIDEGVGPKASLN